MRRSMPRAKIQGARDAARGPAAQRAHAIRDAIGRYARDVREGRMPSEAESF